MPQVLQLLPTKGDASQRTGWERKESLRSSRAVERRERAGTRGGKRGDGEGEWRGAGPAQELRPRRKRGSGSAHLHDSLERRHSCESHTTDHTRSGGADAVIRSASSLRLFRLFRRLAIGSPPWSQSEQPGLTNAMPTARCSLERSCLCLLTKATAGERKIGPQPRPAWHW